MASAGTRMKLDLARQMGVACMLQGSGNIVSWKKAMHCRVVVVGMSGKEEVRSRYYVVSEEVMDRLAWLGHAYRDMKV